MLIDSLALIVALVASSAPGAAVASERRVVVVGSEAADPRFALTLDSIGFWNGTFERLHLTPLFGEPEVLVGPSFLRALENYAWQISRRAGRPAAGPFEPDPPVALAELDADVVILLSSQPLMPFSWPQPGSDRFFVAIRSPRDGSVSEENDLRNVIAHEIGHAMGLSHDESSDVLMCFPCGPLPSLIGSGVRPLSASHESRLIERYSGVGE